MTTENEKKTAARKTKTKKPRAKKRPEKKTARSKVRVSVEKDTIIPESLSMMSETEATGESASISESKLPGNLDGPAGVLGQAVWLMLHSAAHKHMFLTDMEWLVLAPLAHGQVRLFHKGGHPIAMVSWAYLSEEVEKRLVSGKARLAPDDWKSGDRLWLVDFIAPFGGDDQLLSFMSDSVFKGEPMKAIRNSEEGKLEVVNIGRKSA